MFLNVTSKTTSEAFNAVKSSHYTEQFIKVMDSLEAFTDAFSYTHKNFNEYPFESKMKLFNSMLLLIRKLLIESGKMKIEYKSEFEVLAIGFVLN